MIYQERRCDLFDMPKEYWLVQCISADFAMGKGIAVEFNKRFDMKNLMKKCYGNRLPWNGKGMCRFVMNVPVFNLITKDRYYFKPSMNTMRDALLELKWYCEQYHIRKIAMPKIGCGLDGLEWKEVSCLIQSVFQDTYVEIVVCYQ